MPRYVVLSSFTDKGIAGVKESPNRAEAFRATASRAGVKVESLYWTIGPYDVIATFSAPDETTAAAVILGLCKAGNVRTTMLRALDETEFKAVLGKVT
jgi:uncharacterized protein with GYD domain